MEPTTEETTGSTDQRVVYGARCAWWDTIDKASTTASGLPCCPHCAGVLFEVENEAEWWNGAEAHEASGDTGYVDFLRWLRGQCFPGLAEARAAYASRAADPTTPEEWQEAVDGAQLWLLVDSARKYGLVEGGPEVDVARCEEIIARGREQGIEPTDELLS